MSADRREIADRAEEYSLLLSSDVCDDAVAALVSPVRRLAAELDWFPEDSESIVSRIRETIRKGELPDETELSGVSCLGKLNVMMNGLSYEEEDDAGTDMLLIDIEDIDYLFRQCSITDITDGINRNREAAGITPAESADVLAAWDDKRSRILADINTVTDRLSDQEYTGLICRLTKRGMTDEGTLNFDSLVCDLIDRYEIRMNPKIERLTNDLERSADKAYHALTSLDFTFHAKAFNKAFRRWKEAVYPVQRVSMTRRTEHDLSTKTALAIRQMPFKAMKKSCPYESYTIAKDIKDSFDCVPSIRELLAYDFNLISSGVRMVVHKDPEEYIRQEDRSNKASRIAMIFVICSFAFMGLNVLFSPKAEEPPKEKDTVITYDMNLPEKMNRNGEYLTVDMPITGYVLQDTMDDDRTCRVTIKNHDPTDAYFLRFSDRDYGNSSVIGVHNIMDAFNYEKQLLDKYVLQKPDDEESSEEAADVPEDAKILSIIVRSGEETEVMLPQGEYIISYDHGYSWYGWLLRFDRLLSGGQADMREMIYDFAEPYSFESGTDRMVEIAEKTEPDAIVINEEAS